MLYQFLAGLDPIPSRNRTGALIRPTWRFFTEPLERRLFLSLSFNVSNDNAGSLALSVAAGDLGNGLQDIVVAGGAQLGSTAVDVYLNQGNGTFATPMVLDGGDQPYAVALGSFTSSGRMDIAVTSFDDDTVSVFLNEGNEEFSAPIVTQVGSEPDGLAVADFNNDGNEDLVVANRGSNTVGVLLGNGDGTFKPMVSYAVGTDPGLVAVGDFNDDNHPDIVSEGFGGSGSVSVLINNGDGTFGPVQNLPGGGSGIAVADLGNGQQDLIASGFNSLEVLMGNGNGTFAAPTIISSNTDAGALATGDFNGDGVPDLAFADYNNQAVDVMLGNGNGTFQPAQAFSVSGNPYDLVADDFNDDGQLDLAAVNHAGGNPLSVLLNTTPTFSFNSPTTVTLSNHPLVIASADLTGDGIPDLIEGNQNDNTLQVLLGNGNGTFKPAESYSLPNLGVSAISVMDLGNGHPDIIAAGSQEDSVTVLLGDGTGHFTVGPALNNPLGVVQGPDSIAVGDLNGDGKPDLVVANAFADGAGDTITVFLGNGDGTFGSPEHYALPPILGTNGEAAAVAIGDFNGSPDIVATDSANNRLDILLGNGSGHFVTGGSYSVGTDPKALAVGDLNGDGKPDIAVAGSAGYLSSVLLGNGNGTFKGAYSISTATCSPTQIIIADVNQDGHPDLITISTATKTANIILGNGNGTFRPAQLLTLANYPSAVAVADFNGDGAPDIAVAYNVGETVGVFLNTTPFAPRFASSSSGTLLPGTTGSFTITTVSIPTAMLSESGALPAGVTFVDNGNGTATLAGTPAANSSGIYVLTLTASNGNLPNGTQTFTLTVDQAPAITSANSATFVTNQSGTFTITATGIPNAALTEMGSLPAGITFTDNGNGTATLAGTPSVSTTTAFPLTIQASNGVGGAAMQTFTLTVEAPVITMSGGMLSGDGTDGDDTAAITYSGGNVQLTIDGMTQSFAMTSVSAIMINLGDGNDSLMVGSNVPAVNVSGGSGNDTIMANNTAADTVSGGSGADLIMGGGSGSMLTGNGGNDNIVPMNSNETVKGNGGNDTISSIGGSNMLLGGAGDDLFLDFGAPSGNMIDGGPGLNLAQSNLKDTMANITQLIDPPPEVAPAVLAASAVPLDSGAVTDSVSDGILRVVGTSGDDTISLSSDGTNINITANDTTLAPVALAGLVGVSVKGKGGDDIITIDSSVTLPATLNGNGGNDSLTGGGGDNIIISGAGNDTLVGGEGMNLLVPGSFETYSATSPGNDSLVGGTGYSIADYSYRTDGMFLSNDGKPDSGDAALDETTTISTDISAILGGTGDDTIVGTHGGEFLSGGHGADSIQGGGADDLLVGGKNRDTVAVAAEPVTLYLRDNKPDDYSGVNDPDEDLLVLDSIDQLLT